MITTTETLFTGARTQSGRLPQPVSDATPLRLHAPMTWVSISAESCPSRRAFVRSPAAKVDAAFSAGTTAKTKVPCALGHGDPARLQALSPRPSFDEACQLG